MESLADIAVFVRVIEKRSFTSAAKDLQVSTSAVSKHVARLEACLSLKLIERSAPNLKPTEAGDVFYEHCLRILAAVETARTDTARLSSEIGGMLRVHSTHGVGMNLVAPVATEFMKLHASVAIELSIGEFPVDLASRRLDIVIARRHFGRDDPRAYESLVSRNLGPMPYAICAAPEYIRRHGVPTHPKELERRSCLIHLTQKRNPDEWFFADRDEKYSVKVRGVYRSNLESAVLLAAVEGLGIARLSEHTARAELDAGRLVSIFDGAVQSGRTVKAFYNRSQYVPRKISAFVDLLHKRYKQIVVAH